MIRPAGHVVFFTEIGGANSFNRWRKYALDGDSTPEVIGSAPFEICIGGVTLVSSVVDGDSPSIRMFCSLASVVPAAQAT